MISSSAKMLGVAAIAALPVISSAQGIQPSVPAAPAPLTAAPKEEPKAPLMAEPSEAALPATPTPAIPVTPSLSVNDSIIEPPLVVTPAPITPDDSVISSQPPVAVLPVPTIPAADVALLDKAVKAMNINNVDEFVSIFDGANFVFITPKADRINNMPELKVQWGNLFGATGILKGVKTTFTPSKIIELAPGAVSYDGSLVFTSPEGKTIRGVISGSMKYADDVWKVSTMNFSVPDMIKAHAEAEAAAKQSGSSPMFMGIAGLILGALAAMFMSRKKKSDGAQLTQ